MSYELSVMLLCEFLKELVNIDPTVGASSEATGTFDVQIDDAELEVLVHLPRSL